MLSIIIRHFNKYRLPYLLLTGYMVLNAMTLMRFPMIHSDELWLKGIADEVFFQNKLWITEPFFDLYPRVAHPFRWLYVLLQQMAMLLGGPDVSAMRLLSLGAGGVTLGVFYRLLRLSKLPALLGTFLLGINIQFVYALHFGRQEMIILLIQVLLMMALFSIERTTPEKHHLQGRSSAILIGASCAGLVFLSIGVHPNSFLLGLMTFAMLGVLALKHRISLMTCLTFVGFLSIGFVGLVFIGEWYVTGCFKAYLAYGASLGRDALPGNRFTQYLWYFYKLFFQVGGTYDLFNIRIWLFLLVLVLFSPIFQKKITLNWVGLMGILLGLFVLGRNNQLAILFVMPFLIYALMTGLAWFHQLYPHGNHHYLASIVSLSLCIIFSANLIHNITTYEEQHFYDVAYEDVIREIDLAIPDNVNVLGNLNIIEAHPSQRFFDIRNLAYLADTPTTFASYIEERDIRYLIVHDEMAYIEATNPTWNILYGPLSYAPEMKAFLRERCEIVSVIDNPIYAMRIAKYSGTYPWQTTIYHVLP